MTKITFWPRGLHSSLRSGAQYTHVLPCMLLLCCVSCGERCAPRYESTNALLGLENWKAVATARSWLMCAIPRSLEM